MPLIIAIVLIAIIGIKVLGDKTNEWDYNAQKKEWQDGTARFDELYVDKSIEEAIRAMFDDKSKLGDIHKEVDLAMGEMEHWRGSHIYLNPTEFVYKNGKFTQKAYKDFSRMMERDRQVALDIMLANRGKVSKNASLSGYDTYICTDYSEYKQQLKEKQFELVAWIQKKLERQGVRLSPVYVCSDAACTKRYAWLGSHYAPDPPFGTATYKPFQHSLVEPPRAAIPKPYYDKK